MKLSNKNKIIDNKNKIHMTTDRHKLPVLRGANLLFHTIITADFNQGSKNLNLDQMKMSHIDTR